MDAILSWAIQGMLLSNIRGKDLLNALRGLIKAKHLKKKHPFQTDAVASSWLNQSRDVRKSKTRPRNKHQIIRQKLITLDDRSEAYMIHKGNHEARVTSYIYKIRPKIRGPFDGC